MITRRRFHRSVFLVAALYNICWGIYCVVDPQWLFRLTGGAAEDRAEVVSALGLVIGLYGLLYFAVARDLEHGSQIVAVGLAGKVLGPIGVAYAVAQRSWPASTFAVCLTNDFVWLIPFAMYLHDVRQYSKDVSLPPWRVHYRGSENSESVTRASSTAGTTPCHRRIGRT